MNIKNEKLRKTVNFLRICLLTLVFVLLITIILDLINFLLNKADYPWGWVEGGFSYISPNHYLASGIIGLLFLVGMIFCLLKRKYLFFLVFFFGQLLFQISL